MHKNTIQKTDNHIRKGLKKHVCGEVDWVECGFDSVKDATGTSHLGGCRLFGLDCKWFRW